MMVGEQELLAAFIKASTLVAVGIHHLDLFRGGSDLSAGGNCLMVISCKRFLKNYKLVKNSNYLSHTFILPVYSESVINKYFDLYLTTPLSRSLSKLLNQ